MKLSDQQFLTIMTILNQITHSQILSEETKTQICKLIDQINYQQSREVKELMGIENES